MALIIAKFVAQLLLLFATMTTQYDLMMKEVIRLRLGATSKRTFMWNMFVLCALFSLFVLAGTFDLVIPATRIQD